VTLATPLLENFLAVVSGLSLGTLVPNLKSVALTVFELLALTPIDRPLRTHRQTDRQTHIERTHYLRHSLRSLGGDKNTILLFCSVLFILRRVGSIGPHVDAIQLLPR